MVRKHKTDELVSVVSKIRNNYLDVLKGFAILMVVLGHSIQMHQGFDDNFVFRFIYAFHMPLFIFVSGAVASYGSRPMNFTFLRNKFITLVVPFLMWTILAFGLDRAYKTTGFLHYVKHVIANPDTGLWFLPVLFLLFCSLALIQWLKRYIGSLGYAVAWLAIYALPATHFGLGLVRWHLPFFLAGFLIFKHRARLVRYWMPVAALCLVSFPIMVAYWHRTTEPVFSLDLNMFMARHQIDAIHIGDSLTFNFFQFLITGYKYLVAFSGIGFVYNGLKLVVRVSFLRAQLARLGQYTLDIYVLSNHFLFLGFGAYWLNILSSFVLAVLASLIVSFLVLRRFDILNRLFLGGRTAVVAK